MIFYWKRQRESCAVGWKGKTEGLAQTCAYSRICNAGLIAIQSVSRVEPREFKARLEVVVCKTNAQFIDGELLMHCFQLWAIRDGACERRRDIDVEQFAYRFRTIRQLKIKHASRRVDVRGDS